MILSQPKSWWFALLAVILSICGSVGQYQGSFVKRALFKNWRKKAEEHKVSWFDRLPPHEERSYTPVSSLEVRRDL